MPQWPADPDDIPELPVDEVATVLLYYLSLGRRDRIHRASITSINRLYEIGIDSNSTPVLCAIGEAYDWLFIHGLVAGPPGVLIGVNLMRQAFSPDKGGPLVEPTLDRGEQVATMDLFAGAIGAFKNPSSHRQVDYGDATVASEAVLLADLLLRMLDRYETSPLDSPQSPARPEVG